MSDNEKRKQWLKEQTQKERKKERKKLIIDFDEALQEHNDEPIEVKFRGESYSLPASAPAWLPLFINRHQNEDGIVDDSHNLELIARLLGSEFADKIMNSGNDVSFEAVNTCILEPVMEHWGLGFQDESGNEKTPS